VLGLITGSGFYDVPHVVDRSVNEVNTPYGPVALTAGTWDGQPVGFLARHGTDHSIPPHAVNYRANVWALRHIGVELIVATAVSGGISPSMTPGSLALISDFIDFTAGRDVTFFDGITDPMFESKATGVTHTDMTNPYDPEMQAVLRRAGDEESIEVHDEAIYCVTNGPRFETAAEIKMMSLLGGDLVGMTGYPEVALAREAGMRYVSVGVVSNWAAGVSDREISVAEVYEVIEAAADRLYRLVGRAIGHYQAGLAS